MKTIYHHSADINETNPTELISDSEYWINMNGDLDNPNVSKDDWEVDNEFDTDLNYGIEDPEFPEQWDVCAAPNVPGLIWPTRRSNNTAQKGFMTVNAMQTKRNKAN